MHIVFLSKVCYNNSALNITPEYYYQLKNDSSREEEYKKILKELSNITSSRDFFKNQKGEVYPKRKELHNDIINNYLKRHRSLKKPALHIITGSIGSGKTSIKDSVIKEQENFLYINFDDIKKRFPEYEILKKINPKKAAEFVQSESAKIAGMLFRKSVKEKVNIIYEKNLVLYDKGKLFVLEEMGKAFKKNYSVSIHVVFLNTYKEAWSRVQKRYENIRRYVPEKKVRDTFNSLFPNLNKIMNRKFKEGYVVGLYYNNFGISKILTPVGMFYNKEISDRTYNKIKNPSIEIFRKQSSSIVIFNETWQFLPREAKNHFKELDFFKNLDIFKKRV